MLNVYKPAQKEASLLHLMIQLLFLDTEKLQVESILQLQKALRREKKSFVYQQQELFIRQSLELPRRYKTINTALLNWIHNEGTRWP